MLRNYQKIRLINRKFAAFIIHNDLQIHLLIFFILFSLTFIESSKLNQKRWERKRRYEKKIMKIKWKLNNIWCAYLYTWMFNVSVYKISVCWFKAEIHCSPIWFGMYNEKYVTVLMFYEKLFQCVGIFTLLLITF